MTGQVMKMSNDIVTIVSHDPASPDKTTHSLPNGCVKRNLDDNGIVKIKSAVGEGAKPKILTAVKNDVCPPSESHCECQHGDSDGVNNDNDQNIQGSQMENSPVTDKDIIESFCKATISQEPSESSQQPKELSNESCDECTDLSGQSKESNVDTNESNEDSKESKDLKESNDDSKRSNEIVIDVFYGIEYVVYESELQMPDIMRLITKDLSEPYSIYTYRYFIHNWPKLCFLVSIQFMMLG